MEAQGLTITRPCPIDLDARGVDRSRQRIACDHCHEEVHVLSNMSREAAMKLVGERRGQRLCVSYRRYAAGAIVFADDPPAAALVPVRRLRRAPAIQRAAGALLRLAACAPHGEGPALDEIDGFEDPPVEVVDRHSEAPCVPEAPPVPIIAAPAEPIVAEPAAGPAPTGRRAAKKEPAPREHEWVDGGISP
jgi:hypothetical protein